MDFKDFLESKKDNWAVKELLNEYIELKTGGKCEITAKGLGVIERETYLITRFESINEMEDFLNA